MLCPLELLSCSLVEVKREVGRALARYSPRRLCPHADLTYAVPVGTRTRRIISSGKRGYKYHPRCGRCALGGVILRDSAVRRDYDTARIHGGARADNHRVLYVEPVASSTPSALQLLSQSPLHSSDHHRVCIEPVACSNRARQLLCKCYRNLHFILYDTITHDHCRIQVFLRSSVSPVRHLRQSLLTVHFEVSPFRSSQRKTLDQQRGQKWSAFLAG